MLKSRKSRVLTGSVSAVVLLFVSIGLILSAFHSGNMPHLLPKLGLGQESLTRNQVAEALADSAAFYRFPGEMDLSLDPGSPPVHAVIEYTFDARIQETVEKLFRQYGPDYGAFVALDAKTGRILSMVSYSRNPALRENLALRSTFPSASVFKVVTAAAAIEQDKFTANTVIPFSGQSHTLYRHNVFKSPTNRWTRYLTLKQAFAQSINTVFAKIGALTLHPDQLKLYASRFGFNRRIASDMPMQEGRAPISQDPWRLAETASGFTRDNTMSPLQGALIASTIVNDGVMMEPYLVSSVYHPDGTPMYTAQSVVASEAVDPSTAREIRKLMRETITNGTCRHSFHGFSKGACAQIDVGGKTGTLRGLDPAGTYDWFVGFADGEDQRIAFASLTIHRQQWRVKSSYIARRAIEVFFAGDTEKEKHRRRH